MPRALPAAMERTVLITGGSVGIGEALAHEFARNGHDLIIVARDQAELNRVEHELRTQHGVEVVTLAYDLEQAHAPEAVKRDLDQRGIKPDILVNNAGHGQRGKFWEIPLESHLSIVRLNIEALLRLTRIYVPEFVERGHGRILNLASIASFQPGPLLASYHASKAFVLSLSIALREELKDTGVTVTALAPGPTDTNFFPRADMEHTVIKEKGNVMQPEEITKGAYDALMKGDDIYIPGGMNKALTFMRRFLPKPIQAILNEQFYKETDSK